MKSQNRKSGNEEIIKKQPHTHPSIHPSLLQSGGERPHEKKEKRKEEKRIVSDWLIRRWITRSRFISHRILFFLPSPTPCSTSQTARDPSIHLELLLHAATKEDVGGLNVLQKSSKEKKKDDLYYDLMHTMCVCRGGSLPTPHRIKVSANSLVLARVSLGATNDGIVQGCLAGLEGLFRRINHMK